MKSLLAIALCLAAVPVAGLAFALWLGGPAEPPTMQGITQAFRTVDYGALPEPLSYAGRDGVRLAYRHYPPAAPAQPRGSVVLVHGSSATAKSMHSLAEALAAANYSVYALDIRGHGQSGTKGRIDYIGQLEDDLTDFVAQVDPPQPRTLAGFSSGGGFVLRYAAGPEARAFRGFLLLSPFLHQDSASQRKDSGGWVRIGVARLIAQTVLNRFGVTAFNHLPVARFAIDEENRDLLTSSYDFNLSENFRPRADYMASIRAISQPLMVLAGDEDEAFHTERFADIFTASPGLLAVRLLPGIDHAGLILRQTALQASVEAVDALRDASLASRGAP